MVRIMPRLGWAALLCGSMVAGLPGAGRAADRPADQIVADIEAIKPPSTEGIKANDREAIKKYIAERTEYGKKRGVLVDELYKAYPEDARLAKLMKDQWREKLGQPDAMKGLRDELEAIIARKVNTPLVTEAASLRASLAMREAVGKDDMAAAEKALATFQEIAGPKDDRAAGLMYQLANTSKDEARKTALIDRIKAEFPASKVAKQLNGQDRQKDDLGKPFDLEFTDAVKGSPVSMKSLRGKVVVVDFWATWCGPCVAEMPKMKKLYADYKDKGVEFIGVSLDQPESDGGLDKLKKFVADKEIAWPQYYQGDGWDSEFSVSWGINAIPCVFLIDADGNLATTEARGKLEELIPEYLKKAHADLK